MARYLELKGQTKQDTKTKFIKSRDGQLNEKQKQQFDTGNDANIMEVNAEIERHLPEHAPLAVRRRPRRRQNVVVLEVSGESIATE